LKAHRRVHHSTLGSRVIKRRRVELLLLLLLLLLHWGAWFRHSPPHTRRQPCSGTLSSEKGKTSNVLRAFVLKKLQLLLLLELLCLLCLHGGSRVKV